MTTVVVQRLDSDDEEKPNNLPIDIRAAARLANVIRRYVLSAVIERKAPPPENTSCMQAWLVRIVHTVTCRRSASTTKSAPQRGKKKTSHVQVVKGSMRGLRQTLDPHCPKERVWPT